MRNPLVEKYHHYMTEAARLQALVNEQAEYIAELEEAVLALSEDYVTPEREQENQQKYDAAVASYKGAVDEILKTKKKKKKGGGETAVVLSPEEQQRLHDLRTAAELASTHAYLERTHKTKLYGKGGTIIGRVTPPEN